MDEKARERRRARIRDYIDANRKSPVTAVICTVIYGPLGCIYTDPKSAVIALLVAVALGLVYWPLVGLVWVGCIIAAPFQVRVYNAKIQRLAHYVVT